jgi:hypothetical protein
LGLAAESPIAFEVEWQRRFQRAKAIAAKATSGSVLVSALITSAAQQSEFKTP